MSALPSQTVTVIRDPAAAAAILDRTRLRLVGELSEPTSGTDLARRIGEPRQRVNYHLRELEKAGLVRTVGERRKGNCNERLVQAVATSYLVSPEVLGAVSADPSRIPDRTSSAYMVAAAGEVIREVGVLRERADRAGKKLPTLTVQAQVRFDSAEAMNGFAEELTLAVARLAAKYHRDESVAPEGRLFKVFGGSYPAITREEEPGASRDASGGPDQRPAT